MVWVFYMAHQVYSADAQAVQPISKSMYLSGTVLQGWFLLIVMRDFAFIVYEFFFGDQLGFWRALSYHLLSVPVDSFVLLVLCSWGAIVMSRPSTVSTSRRSMANQNTTSNTVSPQTRSESSRTSKRRG